MPRDDVTFTDMSAFGSSRWAATTLGKSPDWFRKNLQALDIAGFPQPDPITRLYLKADIRAWLDRRRQIPDRDLQSMPQGADRKATKGVNYDAL